MKPVVGTVVSNKMQKSVVVAVDRLFHNKVYNRYVKRTSKFMAHDEKDECNIGDRSSSGRKIDRRH
uniref:Putative ovule protein n=1 Tax=Solanum chacoense TaxID=4108 RepID=A0A0V0GKM0_SOLCH